MHRSLSGQSRRFQQTLVMCTAIIFSAVAVFAAMSPGQAAAQKAKAQKKAKPTSITGKLVSMKKSGRTTVLTVETEGEMKEFPITARVGFAITAKGDDGFLADRQFVSCSPVLTNKKFFGKNFTVYLGPRKPKAVLAKAPKMAGVSMATWNVAGLIAGRQQDKDYPDYEIISVRVGKRTARVYLDKGYSVTVRLADRKYAEPGSAIELHGRPASRNRFTVTNVVVTLSKPLKSADFFSQESDKRSTKKKSTKKRGTN